LPEGIDIAVIDCLTVWVGNCLHKQVSVKPAIAGTADLLEALKDAPCNFIIVTNEVGLGIVPDNELARNYRDTIGALNRQIAAMAQKVIFMVSGIPMVIKDNRS
jgi:adenosylcobinamide kinase/adenosylcobinamide-phosphate guanylyltransferase